MKSFGKLLKVSAATIVTLGLGAAAIQSPAEAQTVNSAVAAGASWTLAVRNDGTVQAWGDNSYGQLGDGTTTMRTRPVHVSGLTNIALTPSAVAGGDLHSLAVKKDGTVWAWGNNSRGQLGDGTTTTRHTPVQVAGLSGVIAVAAEEDSSLALKSDGTVWAWGENDFGQLGNDDDPDHNDQLRPVQVQNITGAKAIAAGDQHGVAVKSDGTAWAWGSNSRGELGDGDRSVPVRFNPVQVQLSGTAAPRLGAVAARGEQSIIAMSDGSVRQWGFPGATTEINALRNVVSVGIGDYSAFAVKTDGTVMGWGMNTYGQLGNGTYDGTDVPTPVKVLTNITTISGGVNHTAAMRADGTVFTFGIGSAGALGNGSTANKNIPTAVTGTP